MDVTARASTRKTGQNVNRFIKSPVRKDTAEMKRECHKVNLTKPLRRQESGGGKLYTVRGCIIQFV